MNFFRQFQRLVKESLGKYNVNKLKIHYFDCYVIIILMLNQIYLREDFFNTFILHYVIIIKAI